MLLMFSGGRQRVHWEQMDYGSHKFVTSSDLSNDFQTRNYLLVKIIQRKIVPSFVPKGFTYSNS